MVKKNTRGSRNSSVIFTVIRNVLTGTVDLGDFSGILQKSPRIVGGQNLQSMREKIGSSKNRSFTFS